MRKFNFLARPASKNISSPTVSSISATQFQIDLADYSHSRPNDNLWNQLADNVTAIVGLKEAVVGRNKSLRYFWTLLLFAGIGGTVFYIYETGKEYLTFPTATKVELDRNLSSYSFPPIIMCPPFWVDMDKVNSMNLSMDALMYSLSYFDWFHNLDVKNVTQARSEFSSFYKTMNFSSLQDFYARIATDWPRTGSEEEFGDIPGPAYYCGRCSKSRPLTKEFISDTVCYTLHIPGVSGGLIRSNNLIYAKTEDKSDSFYRDIYNVWYLVLPQSPPYESCFSTMLMAKQNRHYMIKVGMKKVLTLSKPGAPCLGKEKLVSDDDPLITCLRDCEDQIYQKALNCSRFLIPGNDLSRTCNSLDPHGNGIFRDFLRSEDANTLYEYASGVCFNACPYKCERTVYEVHMMSEVSLKDSSGGYTDFSLIFRGRNMTVISLEISHSAIEEGGVLTYEEVYTYSSITLVNNIGGTLGLFIGGTVLTVAQVFLVCGLYWARKIWRYLHM